MKTPYISTADFSEIRTTTLAAYEIPALFETVAENAGANEIEDDTTYTDQEGVSVNAYGSPLSLWEMKSGHYTPKFPDNRSLWSRIKWGVCQSIIDANNLQGRKAEGIFLNDDYPGMSSKVDMEVANVDENWEPMIAKNVAGSMIGMWRNAIGEYVVPEGVILEAHHHMAVRNSNRCWVVALFGGTTERHFVVERDEEICEMLKDASTEFWACVKNKKRPKARNAQDQKIIGRLNALIDPVEAVKDMRGNNLLLSLLSRKDKLNAEIKTLKEDVDAIDAQLKETMYGVGSAIISDTHQLKWIKTGEKEVSYTSPASAYLRVSKINTKAAGTPLQNLTE